MSEIITIIFNMEIHIGHLIKQEVDRQGRRPTWLAKCLNCNRSNVYSIFQRKNIDIEMLFKISHLLKHNFFRDLTPLVDNEIDNCTIELDNMSKNLLQPV